METKLESRKRPRALGGPLAYTTSFRKACWQYLSPQIQQQLETNLANQRLSSRIASLSTDAEAPAYFDARAIDLEKNCESIRTEISYFKEAVENGEMERDIYIEVSNGLQEDINKDEMELRVIKRQKKHLLEDIEERTVSKEKTRQLWVDLLLDKVRLAGKDAKPSKKTTNQNSFRDAMMDYYRAEKIVLHNGTAEKWQYCVVTGEWYPQLNQTSITAAYIVPKLLGGSELNQLFDVGETVLSKPRNSIPILSVIERAFNNGDIVIVPAEMDGTRVLSLKLVLVNETFRNKPYFGYGKEIKRWAELDGKGLRFLSASEVQEAQATLSQKTQKRLEVSGKTPEIVSANRPAQRYLYFRCVATYLLAKRKAASNPELTSWISQYEATRRTIWLTPGRYVRQSMMSELAVIAGDMYLPDAREMFPSDPEKRAGTDEKISAIALKQKLLENEETARSDKNDEGAENGGDDMEG